jgi:hypothetical protein
MISIVATPCVATDRGRCERRSVGSQRTIPLGVLCLQLQGNRVMGVKRYKKGMTAHISSGWRRAAALIKQIQKYEIGITQQTLHDELVAKGYGIEFDTFKDYLKPRREPNGVDSLFSYVASVFADKWPEPSERSRKKNEYSSRLYAALAAHRTSKEGTQLVSTKSEREQEVFNFKLTHRKELAAAAMHYHAAINEVHDSPLIAKASWVPSNLMPLSAVDHGHGWIDRRDNVAPFAIDIFGSATCVEWTKKMKPDIELYDGFGYRLREVATRNGSLHFVFQSSNYFAFYNTCEALAFELAQWCIRHPGRLPNPVESELGPRRSPEAIFDLSTRNAVPGLDILLVFFNGRNGDHFFMHDRSSSDRVLAEAQNTYSVVPAGTFGPDSYKDSYHERDFSLRRAIYRELAEELLGKRELEKYQHHGGDFMDEIDKVREFVDAERKGHLKIFFFGLGPDPVNAKADILLCIAADAHAIGISDYKKTFRKNWEGEHFVQPWSEENLLKWSTHPAVYPAGSGCLNLARTRHFDELSRLFKK